MYLEDAPHELEKDDADDTDKHVNADRLLNHWFLIDENVLRQGQQEDSYDRTINKTDPLKISIIFFNWILMITN